ncbi:MAG: DNA polymerase III subunit alpha [Chloroflexota bacterium]
MFTHLHNHTEYSLLDGLSKIGPMVQRARESGMEALAITDHGGLYGAIEFYTECKEAGIKPIIGLEAYLAQESRHSKSPADKSPHHLLLLARDMEGYRNLLQLSSKAHLEGFYYKPRVDRELLREHSGGLIAFSGCPAAEVPRLLLEGRIQEAKEAALWYRDTFGEFFLELQRHGNIPDLPRLNEALLELSKETGLPLVATNDNHYVYQEDAPFQDILICIHTNTNIYDDKRLKMSDDSYYLKSPQDMEDLFADLPEAIANTQRIADMCDLELDFSQLRLPEYKTPEGVGPGEYLARLCQEGMIKRYPNSSPEVQQRLAYELEVIGKTQFDNYMLVVWDIATFTRENNILFGVRGSAAASLVLYCLGVTDIDPLQYRLVFERFLNLERHEMPDIDMDFQDDRRDEVIAYVRRKYGGDHVAQIITFGTLGAKAALRDTGRALGMAYSDVDRVARLIPFRVHSLGEALEASTELKDIYEADETLKNLVDTARHLEGVVRHASTHAAGVVITKEPLVEYLPLQRPIRGGSSEDMAMTQYPMEPIAKLGLLKMDFLGLTNLTILEQARRTVAQRRGVHLDLRHIPLDDEKTFGLLSNGETTGVFQLEGAGMRRYIQKLKPNSLGDVAAMIALYRPGPMEHIDTFIDAKQGKAPIRHLHPILTDILEETYGVIVYQDQVLLIAQAFAGYSLGEADVVRKAMGKKIPEMMRHEREKFLEGALKQGFSRDLAEEVFHLVEPFAGYAFNKAHSVSYAMIAYWTAYFKANYSEEYMAAVMNAHAGQGDKIASDVTECLRLGIPVLLPDVNCSEADFSIDVNSDGKPTIRFGLATVKNVGSMAVIPLVEERKKNGPYRSVEDLCRRADLGSLNRRAMESLTKVGALDSLGDRGSLLASVERIISLAQREARLKGSGQTTMFDLFGEAVSTPISSIELEEGEVLRQEKLAWEKELLGTFISENPLSALAYRVSHDTIISRDGLDNEMDGKRVNVVGQVSSQRSGLTRDGKPFAAVALDLLGGSIEVMVWSNAYERTRDLWYEGSLVEVVGKIRLRDDDISVHCDEAKPYRIEDNNGHTAQEDEYTPEPAIPAHTVNGTPPSSEGESRSNGTSVSSPSKLWIRLEESSDVGQDEHMLREVVKLLMNYPGKGPVALRIKTDGKTVIGDLPSVSVNYCPELHQELVAMVGETGVEVVGGDGV